MLRLERPLVVFDFETTGTNIQEDRIIEFSFVKVGEEYQYAPLMYSHRVNPCRPISKGAMEVHGITDEMVADCPIFPEFAPHISGFLAESDLAGFSMIDFDLPLLEREFARTSIPFSREGRKLIDIHRIYRKYEPRDLTSAVKFYLGREHEGAHGAQADALATAEILREQIARYELPETVGELHTLCIPENWVDSQGKFLWKDEVIVFGFGKYNGTPIKGQPDYLKWIMSADFPPDVKAICQKTLEELTRGV